MGSCLSSRFSATSQNEGALNADRLVSALAGKQLDEDYLGRSSLLLDTFEMPQGFNHLTGKLSVVRNKYTSADALDIGDAYRMLSTGYLEMEHGYVRCKDGTYYIACYTDFGEDVSGEMFDWWFCQCENTEKYRWWHPNDHKSGTWNDEFFAVMPHERAPGHYVGHTHKVVEAIGGNVKTLEICFLPPAKRFDVARFELAQVSACLVARIYVREYGLIDSNLIAVGHLVHMVRKNEQGKYELRSRFWLGDVYMEETESNCLSAKCANCCGNTRCYRNFKLSDRLAEGLWRHCAEEMSCLREFLPSFYIREAARHATLPSTAATNDNASSSLLPSSQPQQSSGLFFGIL